MTDVWVASDANDDEKTGVRAPHVIRSPRPIFKTAGGKSRLLPELLDHLPRGGIGEGRYIEPFCGGAALFFALSPLELAGQSILGDANVDLVETYSALAHDVEAVIRCLDNLLSRHAEDPSRHYYFMRDIFNDLSLDMGIHEKAALVLYLNRACFNGLWRVNKEGKFNVPLGKMEHVEINPDRLRDAAAALSGALLMACDYRVTCGTASEGDFVYVDPPYDGGFHSYTRSGFGPDDQALLYGVCQIMAKRGIRVLVSNHDTELVRDLFGSKRGVDWRIHEIDAPRSIAANGGRRQRAKELLISSYEPRGSAS
jgi:DNA adenine methylase